MSEIEMAIPRDSINLDDVVGEDFFVSIKDLIVDWKERTYDIMYGRGWMYYDKEQSGAIYND